MKEKQKRLLNFIAIVFLKQWQGKPDKSHHMIVEPTDFAKEAFSKAML